ncbi:hypothetical protein M3Y99_01841700 [Aphelenchoides fujianensis]|nr:hypothetical protein M3Y99_01841700 [Aphelenchoides fujianensis]
MSERSSKPGISLSLNKADARRPNDVAAVFGDESDDEEAAPPSKRFDLKYGGLKAREQRAVEKVYEAMEEKRSKSKTSEPKEKEEKSAKYIGRFMEAKKKRDLEKLLRDERKQEKEREEEGEEFKDKESSASPEPQPDPTIIKRRPGLNTDPPPEAILFAVRLAAVPPRAARRRAARSTGTAGFPFGAPQRGFLSPPLPRPPPLAARFESPPSRLAGRERRNARNPSGKNGRSRSEKPSGRNASGGWRKSARSSASGTPPRTWKPPGSVISSENGRA